MSTGKRTGIDFSRHEVIVFESDRLKIWHLKQPGTVIHNIKYINCDGIMAVTGDFGNWIFCREFHPSADGGVSDGYWDEKLRMESEQKSHQYSPELTKEAVEKFKKEFPDIYGREMNEEEKYWVESLEDSVDDYYEYIYRGHRENPSEIDHESVPFEEERIFWLKCVYDGFDEICRRMKEEKENNLSKE